jgi:hypothetical protein
MRSARRGQAVVEFGIVALLFTALLFAVIDFGLLLNTWLAVSSGSRDLARNASVGKHQTFLQDEARHLMLPSVSTLGKNRFCCDVDSAVEVKVEYLPASCSPSPANCAALPESQIGRDYPFPNLDHTGSCSNNCRPLADDLVRVTVIAHGAQVITPLIRPFFGCLDGTKPTCPVALTSSTLMRFEGPEFP